MVYKSTVSRLSTKPANMPAPYGCLLDNSECTYEREREGGAGGGEGESRRDSLDT